MKLKSLLGGLLLAVVAVAVSAQQPVIVDCTAKRCPAAMLTAKSANDVQGTLRIIHGDDFASGKSAYQYHVLDATGKATKLDVAHLPAEVRSGSQVRVEGKRIAARAGVAQPPTVVPSRIIILAAPLKAGAMRNMVQAVTSNNVLVILANFSNTAAPAFSRAQAQATMVNVGQFFSEASYGQQALSVTVTPWLTMTLPAGGCDFTVIGNAADAAAAAWNPSSYPFVVYLFPGSPCGWSGLAYVGWGRAWINGPGAFNLGVIAHEMGHNFGLLHAGSLNSGGGVAEYGDQWSTMGGANGQHYNARQKEILGWIPASSVKTQTSGTATYSLDTLEDAGGTTYAVRIPTTSPLRTYYVESRRATPNAAQIRLVGPFEQSSGVDDSQVVLNATPLANGDIFAALDVTITVGVPQPPPPPPPPGVVSPDGTTVPPATQITDDKGNVWTFGGNTSGGGRQILINGQPSNPKGGFGLRLLWTGGQMRTLNDAGNWFAYDWNKKGWMRLP